MPARPPRRCSCGARIPPHQPRCTTCERQRNAARADRYGHDHQAQRRAWEPIVATGTVTCPRCGQLIGGTVDNPPAFDLDHLPDGTSHPAHPTCNRSAGNRALD